ncbi:MAG: LacI family DNA-binding transcriptional regulator [Bacilli bacterium]
MITIVDVAKRAKVSNMTVSRVINNATSVSDSTRQRVLVAMEELHYVPNSIARSLISGRTNTIGLIIADMTNPFFTTMARGAEDAAHQHFHRLILCNHDDDIDKEREYIEALISARVDGMIITPASDDSTENLQIVKRHKIPFVFVDRIVSSINADYVVGDNLMAAYELTAHLLRQGHRNIGLISGPVNIHTAKERMKGYEKALREFNIEIRRELIHSLPYSLHEDKTLLGVELSIQSMFRQSPKPTAIFAFNNALAIQAIHALRKAGLKSPDDVAIACFEDVDPHGLLQLEISTACQPAYAFGEQGVHMLFERIKNPDKPYETVTLQPRLYLRGASIS